MAKLALVELDATLVRCVRPGVSQEVESLARAQGLTFYCPVCFKLNGGSRGTHVVHVWFANRGVPDATNPTGRWAVSGTSLADVSLQGCIEVFGCWRGWVVQGGTTL